MPQITVELVSTVVNGSRSVRSAIHVRSGSPRSQSRFSLATPPKKYGTPIWKRRSHTTHAGTTSEAGTRPALASNDQSPFTGSSTIIAASSEIKYSWFW